MSSLSLNKKFNAAVLTTSPLRLQARFVRQTVCCAAKAHDSSGIVKSRKKFPCFALAASSTLFCALPAFSENSASVDATLELLGDPIVIGGVVVAIAVPILFAVLFNRKDSNIKATIPEKVLVAMEQEPRVLLVDIRNKADVKANGLPDLKSVKRKVVSFPYTQVVGEEVEVVESFVEKLLKLPAVKEDSIIILIDSTGEEGQKVAKEVADALETETVYYVEDGSEGPRGWKALGGPWKEASQGLELSLPSFQLPRLDSLPNIKGLGNSLDNFAEDFKASPSVLKGLLALGAAGAAAGVLLTEVEVLLELVGVVAAGNFLVKNLLFAKDRERTLKDIEVLVSDKIAAGEAGKDLKRLASSFLELEVKAGEAAVKDKVEAAENGAAVEAAEGSEAAALVQDELSRRKGDAQRWIRDWRARTRRQVAAP